MRQINPPSLSVTDLTFQALSRILKYGDCGAVQSQMAVTGRAAWLSVWYLLYIVTTWRWHTVTRPSPDEVPGQTPSSCSPHRGLLHDEL